tara:strand:- start:159 stop:524 length:366 start_codon:yes stop_codon:yes gene_type:complete
MRYATTLKGVFEKHIVEVSLDNPYGLLRPVNWHVYLLFPARHYQIVGTANMVSVAVCVDDCIDAVDFVTIDLINEVRGNIELEMLTYEFDMNRGAGSIVFRTVDSSVLTGFTFTFILWNTS